MRRGSEVLPKSIGKKRLNVKPHMTPSVTVCWKNRQIIPAWVHQDVTSSAQEWATEHRFRTINRKLGLKGQKPAFITTRPAKGKVAKYQYLLDNEQHLYQD